MRTPLQKLILELRADGVAESVIEKVSEYIDYERRAIESAFMWGLVSNSQYKSQIAAGQEYYQMKYTNDK